MCLLTISHYLLYIGLIYGFILLELAGTTDPCLAGNHQQLGDLLKRSPDYAMDSTPLCDDYLVEGWYTAPSYVMPKSAPGLGVCNTLYPYWMKGTPPYVVGEETDVEICGVGFSSPCQKSFNIRVKRCPSFIVYKLLPLDSCSSGYCFEKTGDCVAETPSDIEVVFHGVSYTTIQSPLAIQHNPVIKLLCRFTPLLDQTLFYHIDWYIDNTRVLENQTVDFSTLDNAVLTTQDLYDAGKKIGASIHCIVGAKKSAVESPCNSSSSALFFAGIEVLTPVLNMSRKGQTTLRFRPTIPYARQTLEFPALGIVDSGYLTIELEFPSAIKSACTADGTNSRYCQMKLPSFKYSERDKYNNRSLWYKEYSLTVYNKDDLGYRIQNSMSLRLKTTGGGENAAKVFEGTTLPAIPINIHDNSTEWKGKLCTSRSDPHMRTFDAVFYECQHIGCKTGTTMVLYENKAHDQEVVERQAGYSEEEATSICNADFQASIPYQICIQNVADFSNSSIMNCIIDLTLTGNPNLTSLHIESAVDECQTLVGLNVTLQEENSTISYEILSICPNSCSGQGECSAGSCTCNAGYGGSDCSFDISRPPNVTSLLGNGLCDITQDVCDDITMFGQFFVENMNSSCFITRNEEGFCFIDGQCIRHNVFDSNSSCLKCDTTADKYNWSNDCFNETTNTMDTTTRSQSTDTQSTLSQSTASQSTETQTTLSQSSANVTTDSTTESAISYPTTTTSLNNSRKSESSNNTRKPDSNLPMAYIIGGAIVAAVIALVITGIVIKKYCFGKTEVKAFRSNNQIGKWNHVDLNISSKDGVQTRPPSIQSHHSPHPQSLPPTHDFSTMYDNTKDRSHLFRAQL